MCHSLAELDFAELAERGIYYYIIDVDNTLAPRKFRQCTLSIRQALQSAVEQGYIKRMVLVSNVGNYDAARCGRVEQIAQELGAAFVCAYWPHIKPDPAPFLEGIKLMPGANLDNTVMIGDQIFTDVKGGNRLNLTTVYVDPLGPDHWVTSWKRVIEKIIFRITGWRQ